MPARFKHSFRAAVLACLGATCPGPYAAADEARVPADLATLPFEARNLGPGAMACMATTAHFYSVDLGTVQPGSRVVHTFWAAPSTGVVFLRNARGDLMPVQSLWCGIAGRAWITRFAFSLPRRAGQRPSPLRFSCRSDAAALSCDAFRPQIEPSDHESASSPKHKLD